MEDSGWVCSLSVLDMLKETVLAVHKVLAVLSTSNIIVKQDP